MNTWEMLKELTENPNKVFENQNGLKVRTCDGVLCYDEDLHRYGALFVGDTEDWEEVPTEVTWQEAVQAWANGKDIKSVIYDEEIFYRHIEGYLEDQNGDAISLDELTEGKWYIL